MRILICYATTEGQTRKICRFVADHLMDNGHSVELLSADDGLDEASELDLNRFDAAVTVVLFLAAFRVRDQSPVFF